MTSISKNMCVNKLNDIVKECNNTYHGTIKMRPVDVKSSTYIDLNKNNSRKDPKFKVGDYIRIRISKYRNIFAKGYLSNWPK